MSWIVTGRPGSRPAGQGMAEQVPLARHPNRQGSVAQGIVGLELY